MDEEVFVYSPDLSLLGDGSCTLVLTGEEADAVRSALANRADELTRRADKTEHEAVRDDYLLDAATCDAVVEKLNKAEGRG